LARILVALLLNPTVESIYCLNGLNDNRFVWLADTNGITATASGDHDRGQYGKPPSRESAKLHGASVTQWRSMARGIPRSLNFKLTHYRFDQVKRQIISNYRLTPKAVSGRLRNRYGR
jgi:hypothetical protein